MNPTEPLVRNISDTACWAAVYRARETDRPDALFRDPFARRLAGARGEQIADTLPEGNQNTWSWVMRTLLFDRIIREQVDRGVDLVLNLAAGLDSRPYRMALPARLQWVEVDLPEILARKEEVLAAEKPVCALERVRLDLADASARRELFARLAQRARRILAVCEGLMIYLTRDEAAALAQDLAAPASSRLWALDLGSPGLLRLLQKNWNPQLGVGGAALKFAPEEGPGFFMPYGWKPVEVNSLLKEAARKKRLSLGLRLMALLPESKGRQGSRPWGAVCLLEKF
jgi:methyltransferase (TIGR00027 family)